MEGVLPGYLRYRVVNPRAINFSDDFETAAGSALTVWHSLGTEAGTDNSINYWTQAVGAWTYAANLITSPNTANNLIYAGHSDWTNISFVLRVKWSTNTAPQVIIHCDGTVNNFVCATLSNAAFSLQKKVGGVLTTVATIAAAPVNGTFYWISVVGTGTAYSCGLFNDSAGAIGVQVGSTSGTIADAGVQSGYAGIGTSAGTTATTTHGGAFANVCYVNGTPPNGWYPNVTTGEPAFAWSAVAPQAGVKTASIQILGSASGNGYWARGLTQTVAGTNVLSAQIKASAGTANVSAGGVTTTNGSASYALQTGSGAMTQNPTAQLNFSGAVGTAYFDTLSVAVGSVTNDLPHLHQSTWSRVAMQPGAPSTSSVGSFKIQLHPPGTEQYLVNKSITDQLSRWQRVEAYLGYDPENIGTGNLFNAGFITGIHKTNGPNAIFELTGVTDVGLAAQSKPFPGEFLSNDVTSSILKSYLGTNELGWSDAFNPYTASNYVAGAVPGFTAGSWSSTTDDGLNVVQNASGTGAVLLSKTGASSGDRWHTQYVEVTGRLTPSADASDAGALGVGLSFSAQNCQDCVYGFVQAAKVGGRYQLLTGITAFAASVATSSASRSNSLFNADDPQGKIPVTIGLLLTTGGSSTAIAAASLVVNGQIVVSYWAIPEDPGTATMYPFLFYSSATSGTATAYYTNLAQFTRFTTDGSSTAAAFGNGTISAATNSLAWGVDPGPTFLDIWSRLATREGNYWRYTPQVYALGTRTIGTVDYAADPGTDRSASIIFSRHTGNLVELSLDDNADTLSGSTVGVGQSTVDGGGLSYWRDITTLRAIGVIEDQALMVTHSDFNSLRASTRQMMSNKTATGTSGHKRVTVLRDPDTADKFRELDKVTIDDPEMGVNMLSCRVLAREFTEGAITEALTLDRFSWHGQELGI